MMEKDQISESDSPSPRSGSNSQWRDGVSLLDIAIILAKYKKFIFGVPALAGLITVGVTYLMSNVYTGRAVLMPPQQQQSAALAMLGQLGAITGVVGSGGGIKNPNDLYIGLLKSRTVADEVIQRFDLRKLYDADSLVDARKALDNKLNVTSSKEGFIVVEFDDGDPDRAAKIANAFVEELDRLNQNLAISDTAKRRLFFEQQLKQVQIKLADAELGLKAIQERTGLFRLEDQARVTVEAIASLRAQISIREVQLQILNAYATKENPDYLRAQQELESLRGQLRKTDRGSGEKDILLSPSRAPEAALEYLRGYRNLKYYETLFELMARQFEIAKVDEARDAAVVQIVDRAIPLEKPSKPWRLLIVIVVGICSFVLTTTWILLKEFWRNMLSSDSSKASDLKSSLPW